MSKRVHIHLTLTPRQANWLIALLEGVDDKTDHGAFFQRLKEQVERNKERCDENNDGGG